MSRLSWLECMVEPTRDDDKTLMSEYRSFFEAGELAVVELTAQVVERATSLRARHGLKTPDALQAACALELEGNVVFLTNDARLRDVTGLRIEIPA